MTAHVIQASGGLGSWATGRRVVERYGRDDVHFLFADVLIEDDDLYRFLIETCADIAEVDASDLAAEALRLPPVETHMDERRGALADLRFKANARIPGLRWIAEGRDPWQVFHDVRFLGNTRIDPCSQTLKREFLRAHLDEHFDPDDTVVYLGIDWTEEHRFEKAQPRWAPYRLEAPLCEAPYIDKDDIREQLKARGIREPRLYELGFPHNNCGGFCIKAGQAHFKNLGEKLPRRAAYHAGKEQELREYLKKDVSILRDRKLASRAAFVSAEVGEVMEYGGRFVVRRTGRTVPSLVPLPLSVLYRDIVAGVDETDPDDIGGCGCVA